MAPIAAPRPAVEASAVCRHATSIRSHTFSTRVDIMRPGPYTPKWGFFEGRQKSPDNSKKTRADGGSALPHPCCDGGQSAWANSTATRPAIGRHGFPWLEHAALRPLAGFVATVLCYTPLRYRLWRYRGADTQTCAPRTHLIIKLRLVIKRLAINKFGRAGVILLRTRRAHISISHTRLVGLKLAPKLVLLSA